MACALVQPARCMPLTARRLYLLLELFVSELNSTAATYVHTVPRPLIPQPLRMPFRQLPYPHPTTNTTDRHDFSIDVPLFVLFTDHWSVASDSQAYGHPPHQH